MLDRFCSWELPSFYGFVFNSHTHTHTHTKLYSPLQLGHAVQLVVVAASEALCERIIFYLQLCNLRTKTENVQISQTQSQHRPEGTRPRNTCFNSSFHWPKVSSRLFVRGSADVKSGLAAETLHGQHSSDADVSSAADS